MACEAYNRSLPQRRAAVNTPQVASITPAQLRMSARMKVVCDTQLSPGARLLYVLLDDRAGQKARCWPSQESLARDLGASRRSIQGWLYELAGAGHIRPQRGQSGNAYLMAWDAQPVAQPKPAVCASDAQPAAHGYMEDFEPEKEPEPCLRCHGTHRITYRGQVRKCGCTVG